MKNKYIYYLIIFIYTFLIPCISKAYDDELTHPHIIKQAIKETNLNSFLQLYFNLKNYQSQHGSDIQLNTKSVIDILREGAEKEDDPLCRAANHFHNPIAPGTWGEGKLFDTSGIINYYCDNVPPADYTPAYTTSNITWGTGFISIDQKEPIIIEKNQWDWTSAREYYFTSITGLLNDDYDFIVAFNENLKNEYLEKTLKSIGYVAHLLQDTSVPAHARDDFSQGHTMWMPARDNLTKWMGNRYEAYLRRNDKTGKLFWNEAAIRSHHPISRLTDLWDTNQFNAEFDGNNVNMNSFGLSEYTNLNFLSEYTMFIDKFPFPKVEHTTIWRDAPPNGFTNFDRKYISSTNGHPGEQIDHLAIVSYLDHYREVYFPNSSSEKLPIYFDELCYDDYASYLIPRAVGFSADLIDYFFRGRIDISPILPQNLVIRGNGGGDVSIFKIMAQLRNSTSDPDSQGNTLFSNENMGEGSLYAVAKYAVNGTVKYSLSKRIYIKSNDNLISATSPVEYNFDFSDSPIPWDASGIDFQVIFRGTLGNEKDMAVAVGRRPLFDGIMEVTSPQEYVYSIIDASTFYSSGVAQPQFFNTLKASLRNQTATKEIQTGTLTAIASYRRLKNYQPDMAGATPTLSTDREETDTYSVSQPISIAPNSVNSTGATEFIFDFTDNPIPAGITDLYLYTVFEGTLHDPAANTDEPGSVVVGIKDLNEPQHLTYWNDTDYFLLRGYPRKADDIRNDPDVVWYGCFVDPHNISESVKFFSINNDEPAQELVNFSLPAGNYSRIIVLSDTPNIYSVADTLRAPDNPLIPSQGFDYAYEFSRTINQLNSDGLWYNSPVLSSRGISQHDRSYFINVWPTLFFHESVPVPDNDLLPVRASFINFPQP